MKPTTTMTNMKLNIKLVVFSIEASKLKIYLTGNTLPSGLLGVNIPVDSAAEKLFDKFLKIPRKDIYSEQLYTFSLEKNEVTLVYYFLIPEHKIYSDRKDWYDLDSIKSAENDKEVILYAVQRLRWKIEYTNVVYSLLPPEFTFSQLQSTYESILGRILDKRNFRKKIISLNIIKPTGHIKNVGPARPAEMFTFTKRRLAFVEIL